MNKRTQELLPEFDPNRKYRQGELTQLADDFLRRDTKAEMCRKCTGRGEKTGNVKPVPQEATDEAGNQLILLYDEYVCDKGHVWHTGEGSKRGIDGENPILFEEHLHSRRRREILNNMGVPDPAIVSGVYNRSHPQGRKVNSEEARRKHGAGWYR